MKKKIKQLHIIARNLDFDRTKSNWIGLNWIGLNWIELD